MTPSGLPFAALTWDVWATLAIGGLGVALVLGFMVAADGLRRALWGTGAVALLMGFGSLFPILHPGVIGDGLAPYTLWPRLGYTAAFAACGVWALVMLTGGGALTVGGVWLCRGVGVAAFGLGWVCASLAFADKLPSDIASVLTDRAVPYVCAVLAPLFVAVAAWFNSCRTASSRWLTRSVSAVGVGAAVFVALELFAAKIPPGVARVVTWREVLIGSGAGAGLCVVVAAFAALLRKPEAAEPEAPKPIPVPPKPPVQTVAPVPVVPPAPKPPPVAPPPVPPKPVAPLPIPGAPRKPAPFAPEIPRPVLAQTQSQVQVAVELPKPPPPRPVAPPVAIVPPTPVVAAVPVRTPPPPVQPPPPPPVPAPPVVKQIPVPPPPPIQFVRQEVPPPKQLPGDHPVKWQRHKLPAADQRTLHTTREVYEYRKGDRIVRVPARIGDRYDIDPTDGILAAGGMGVVLVARDSRLHDHKVLIKMNLLIKPGEKESEYFSFSDGQGIVQSSLAKEYKRRRDKLIAEQRNLVTLTRKLDDRIPVVANFIHDYSAQLHGPHNHPTNWFWESDDPEEQAMLTQEPYLVMRCIDGLSLNELIKSDSPDIGAVGSKERYRVALELAKELATLFAQLHHRDPRRDEEDREDRSETGQYEYWVYQDLKPANLIRTRTGDFYLIDFGGVAQVIQENDGSEDLSGNTEYTAGYHAPEVLDAVPNVTDLSDIYTLGATLFHVVTGEEPPELPKELPAEIDRVKSGFDDYYADLFRVIRCCTLADREDRGAALLELFHSVFGPNNRPHTAAAGLRRVFTTLLQGKLL